MKLTYQLTEEAFQDFNLYHNLNSPSSRKQAHKARILVPMAMILLGLVIGLFVNFSSAAIIIACFGVAAIVWFLRFPAIFRKTINKTVSNWIKEGKHGGYLGEITLELLDNTICETTAGRVTEIAYDNIERIAEDKNYLYIYFGAIMAFIVPLQAFADTAVFNDFLQTLKNKAPSDSVPTKVTNH